MTLTADLREAIQDAALEIAGAAATTIIKMPGGASLRRFYRVTLPTGRPASMVVMELGESPVSEEVSQGDTASELPFINVLRYLGRGEIGVPCLYRFDDRRGLLYLEDLGDTTLEACVAGANDQERRRIYRLAIEELVRMQRYAAANPTGCIAFQRGFDFTLLKWELDHFREWGLEAGAGAQLSAPEREELDRQFTNIANTLASEPRGFVHRDYQSRNLMVEGSGAGQRIRIVDFQDALLGTRAYDLVALLRDSYVILSPSLLDRLVGDYCETAGVAELPFRALFNLQTVQRKLKDAGRFVFIDRVKKNPDFLMHIPSSHQYVVEAFRRLPELSSLREIIAKYIPAFR